MGNQSSSRLEGDRYQHLYSWFELLQLLPEDSPYSHGIVEHPEAGGADDITLFPHPGRPLPAQFTQVKWHVDHSAQYDFELLVEIKKGSKTSILEKLHASHRRLTGTGRVELCLLSNWSAHPDFGVHLDGRTEMLAGDFFTATTKAAKAARALWCKSLGIEVAELERFCKSLRFRLGFGGQKELESRVDERMAWHGLLTGENARHLVTDRVSEWIELGGRAKRVDRAALLQDIDRLALRAPVPHEPAVCLHIHGWVRTEFSRPATVELDWTRHFDRASRRTGTLQHWQEVLLPELAAVAAKLRGMPDGRFVDVRAKAPLTANLAVGFTLSEAAGFVLKTDQITAGRPQRWATLAEPSDAHFIVSSEIGGPGPRLLIGLEVSAPIAGELHAFAGSALPRFDSVTCLRPSTGCGENAIRSESDAVALALSAKRMFRELRSRLQGREVHLVLCCPAAVALFIGHRLNALGPVFAYERTVDGSYILVLHLHSG